MDSLEIAALTAFIVSILWVHAWLVFTKARRSDLFRVLLLDGLALLVVLIGLFAPEAYYTIMSEDSIGEWVTFNAFTLSGLMIAAHLWYSRKDGRAFFSASFLLPITIAAFCLFVAGEEVSWGQRILAFRPPDIFLEQNYQQELNIHNLFKGNGIWGVVVESKHLVMLTAFLFGICFPLATRFIPLLKTIKRFAPAWYLAPYFVLVIAMEDIYPISLTGEACEMYLGLIFLIHTADAYPIDRTGSAAWHGLPGLPTLTAAVFVLGVVTAPLLSLSVYHPDEEAAATILGELRQLQDDLLDPETDKGEIMGRRRLHKRIYTAVQQYYFELPEDSQFLGPLQDPSRGSSGKSRRDRKAYFLDPWYSPYWLYYERHKKIVVLYSFGENRKRDSNLRSDPSLKGDDVGIAFDVDWGIRP